MRLLDRRPVRALLVATTATLALTACGGNDDSSASDKPSSSASADGAGGSAPAPTAQPADGDRIEAKGFSYAVPKGWKEGKNASSAAITLAGDTTDEDGFADNVNVVTDPTIVGITGTKLEDALVTVLERSDVKDVSVREPLSIDGQEAVHTTGLFDINGNEYRVEQYTLSVDGTGYVITFSHSTSTTEAERDAVDQSILASWSWG